MKWKNGVEYKGEFSRNCFCGKGILTNSQGEKYIGNFDKNLFNGDGTYFFNNGSSYKGNFELGLKKGKGIYNRYDGFVYEGEWENNLANGIGKVKYGNCVIKCTWRNGKIFEKPIYEEGNQESCNGISLNFEPEETMLDTNELSHLYHHDIVYSQYHANTLSSFLGDDA